MLACHLPVKIGGVSVLTNVLLSMNKLKTRPMIQYQVLTRYRAVTPSVRAAFLLSRLWDNCAAELVVVDDAVLACGRARKAATANA